MEKITGLVMTVTEHRFRQAFEDQDRTSNFGRAGLTALFDYLENLADDLGEPIEFDVISCCCDYSVDTRDELRQQLINDDKLDACVVAEWEAGIMEENGYDSIEELRAEDISWSNQDPVYTALEDYVCGQAFDSDEGVSYLYRQY